MTKWRDTMGPTSPPARNHKKALGFTDADRQRGLRIITII